jgi:signal transduction histidine kinase
MSIHLTKQSGSFFAGIFANIIADRLSSPEFLSFMDAKDLVQVKPNTAEAYLIKYGMRNFESNIYKYYLVDAGNGLIVSVPAVRELSEFIGEETLGQYDVELLNSLSLGDIAQIRIFVGDDEIYRSDSWDMLPREITSSLSMNTVSPTFEKLFRFFMTEASYFIPGSDGKPVAEVQVRLSAMLNISFYLTLLFWILVAALASFVASMLVTTFFTRTVARPVVVLEKNLGYLAEGNYDELLNSHLHVKKPIMEIQSIADSTNILLDKMHEFNKTISRQNELLEKQNAELEAQNNELTTSRKKISDAQTLLLQNQNLASVGQLTAAISHEINTPLGTINSNVQLQNMIIDMLLVNPDITGDPELVRVLDEMRDAGLSSSESCSHVSMIIKSLKNFSRLDQADFQEADINESAKSVLLLTRFLWKNRIEMHEEFGRLPYVKCYPGLLNQVFMNLLVNAIRSIRDKGDIYIRTWADEKAVYASIRDNGVGISKKKLSSLFETDYTSAGMDKGQGMGLSICKSIIDKHQGTIEGKSELGKGSEFIFSLPIQ